MLSVKLFYLDLISLSNRDHTGERAIPLYTTMSNEVSRPGSHCLLKRDQIRRVFKVLSTGRESRLTKYIYIYVGSV